MIAPKLRLRDGFAGQDMVVIPRPVLAEARSHPLIQSTYPTDVGWFPRAAHHFRDRPQGARQDHLMLCVSGHGYVVIEEQQVRLGAGEIIIIPRGTKHTYWASDDDPWSIYWVHFLGDDADYFVNRMPRRGQPAQVDEVAQEEAVRLFCGCLDALHDGYGLPTLIYASQATQHVLSRLLFRNRLLKLETRAKSGEASVAAVIQYMHDNLDRTLRLEDLARESGSSVSYFSDCFRAQTGQSPMAYFMHLRMRFACRLLDLSDKPVKAVAIETGYRDPYYFSRVFKKCMGISPEGYRAVKKG